MYVYVAETGKYDEREIEGIFSNVSIGIDLIKENYSKCKILN